MNSASRYNRAFMTVTGGDLFRKIRCVVYYGTSKVISENRKRTKFECHATGPVFPM